jgi:carbonic anhydrase
MCNVCGDNEHVPETSRRSFIGAGMAASLLPLLPASAFAAAPPPAGTPAPNAISPDAALKRLLDGNARYVANAMNERDFSAGRAARANAQFPFATILSCADSRVAPELAFDQGPGELFVVRVAGNVVSPDLLASIEYAVHFLGTPLVMVMGHSSCGAVDAAIKVLKSKAQLPGHLPELIGQIKPAVLVAEKTQSGNLLDNAIKENARRQVARIVNSPPILKKYAADRKISVVGAYYDIGSGKVSLV